MRIITLILLFLLGLLSISNIAPFTESALAQQPAIYSVDRREQKSLEANLVAQITRINQFRDVSPRDRYYRALQKLVEQYEINIALYECPFTDVKPADCKLPMFKGNDVLLRRDFVMYLNEALDSITRVVVAGFGNVALSKNDLQAIASESRSLEQDLTQIETRLAALERKTSR